MPSDSFRQTELDRTSYPAWRDTILQAEARGEAQPGPPRSYPGYPRWPLDRVRARFWPPLDRVLARRRCSYPLGQAFPSRRTLSRLLQTAHGITGPDGRGPTPSAGGLQALELYLANWSPAWLPAGLYHYDRGLHALSQLRPGCTRRELELLSPSLERLEGGAFLGVIAGDGERVAAKYGSRAIRFLLLEAGHLMQNLCLASAGLGLATVPLGGFFEADLARLLNLLPTDEVLYLGAVGQPARPGRG
jgi:SagB-type dehydrogenase family enzyme